jgi:hypothetical protein
MQSLEGREGERNENEDNRSFLYVVGGSEPSPQPLHFNTPIPNTCLDIPSKATK